MSDPFTILMCRHFMGEARAVVKRKGLKDIRLCFFPARCGLPKLSKQELIACAGSVRPDTHILVMGGVCLAGVADFIHQDRHFSIKPCSQCFYMVADPDRVDTFLKNRAYLLTPGWAARWKQTVKQWGFERDQAVDFFRESIERLVLLDTGINKKARSDACAFAEYLNLACDIYDAGLGYFQLYFTGQTDLWQSRIENQTLAKTANLGFEKAAQGEMAVDMLSRLTKALKEEEMIKTIMDMFLILFAPQQIVYLQVVSKKPIRFFSNTGPVPALEPGKNALADFESDSGIKSSKNGFILNIRHKEEVLGILKVQALEFPQHRSQYLHLARSMTGIFGMAIKNARILQVLERTEKEQTLMSQILEVFILSEQDADELQTILVMLKKFFKTDAIGIRLKQNRTYPYIKALGFPKGFITEESSACELKDVDLSEQGGLCGRVLSGKTDRSLPGFTSYGSFWTNDLSGIKSAFLQNRIPINFRGLCEKEGFQSMALIPLFNEGKISGLLQINDRQPQKFTDHDIAFLEKVVVSISIAMARKAVIRSLEQAKIQAESANYAKSRFLSNMSHELRTPLNAVLGFSEILRSREIDPQKKRFLDSIHTSGEVLLSLINDVLDLSKIEAGKMVLEPDVMNIYTFMQQINTIFSAVAKKKQLDLVMELDDKIPERLILDGKRLRQIVINLVSNAIKFTDKGVVRFIISRKGTGSLTPDHLDLALTVQDTGKGIPKRHHNTIFEAFQQVSDKNNLGTGLGLDITRKLVQLMGGTITVDSAEGRGATFIITLPNVGIVGSKALHPLIDPGVDPGFELDMIRFDPAAVLIVDDNDSNREMVATYLDGWPFEILFAQDGRQALKKVQKHRPDLVLMDMRMPVMDGYEASAKLKNNKKTKQIPVIAVTANAMKEDEEIISRICDGYLRKPIGKIALVKELMRFIPYHRADAGTEGGPAPAAAPAVSRETLESAMAAVPGPVRADIVSAAQMGHSQGILTCLEKVESVSRALADHLRDLADDYEFDKILALPGLHEIEHPKR